MAFVAQSFSVGHILTAANMNQVDANIDIVRSFHKGPAAPASLVAGVHWIEDDNPSATVWTWQMYDGADQIKIGEFDTTNNIFTPEGANPSAIAGVIETNANIVAHCLVGPVWDKTQAFNSMVIPDWDRGLGSHVTSLMLATVEDTGADTEVNIYDWTSASIVGATPLATLAITGAATPTDITSLGGYVMVSHEDGVTVFSPFSGAWAEQTVGYPKSLSTSTVPALVTADVAFVKATFEPQEDTPSFRIGYGSGTTVGSVYKPDGNLWDDSYGNAFTQAMTEFYPGRFASQNSSDIFFISKPLTETTADEGMVDIGLSPGADAPGVLAGHSAMAGHNGQIIAGGTNGLDLFDAIAFGPGASKSAGWTDLLRATLTRAVNSGYMVGYTVGAWLANSKTSDLSVKANTLTENGTVTEAAVETGAELMGYSGFSAANNLTRASDADWDVITTGAAYYSIWFKSAGNSAVEQYMDFSNAGNTVQFKIHMETNGTVTGHDNGSTATQAITSSQAFDDSVWHKLDFVRTSSISRELFVDGVSVGSGTTDTGSLTGTGTLPLAIGVDADGSTNPATSSTLSLAHLSTTAPSAAQVKAMYETEKGMFVADAKCLLQSGTTDAVLDVSIDPITNKVGVVQVDSLQKWNGLVMEEAIAIDAAATNAEHLILFNDDWIQVNDTNFSTSLAALDVREELTRLAGIGAPAGVDMSKAKAWLFLNGTSFAIKSSYNIAGVVHNGTGLYTLTLAVPFKSVNWTAVVSSNASLYQVSINSGRTEDTAQIVIRNDAGTYADALDVAFVAFGERSDE